MSVILSYVVEGWGAQESRRGKCSVIILKDGGGAPFREAFPEVISMCVTRLDRWPALILLQLCMKTSFKVFKVLQTVQDCPCVRGFRISLALPMCSQIGL